MSVLLFGNLEKIAPEIEIIALTMDEIAADNQSADLFQGCNSYARKQSVNCKFLQEEFDGMS